MDNKEDTKKELEIAEKSIPEEQKIEKPLAFNPISDGERAENTSTEIDLNKTINQAYMPKEENDSENIYNIQYFYDKMGQERDGLDEYEKQSGEKVVDYIDEYDRTINNTGTALDGKTIDEVACVKEATPREIWDTKDVCEQWCYGVYECCRNATNLVAAGVADILGPEGFKTTEEELQSANIADFGPSPEAKSVAGAVVKPVAQFSTGAVVLKGAGSVVGANKLAATLVSSAKTKFGTAAMKGAITFISGMVNEFISFSENATNFSELCKSLGINISRDLLVKNPEDSYFAKKLKNALDGGAAQLVLNAFVGGAKVFYNRLKPVPTEVKGFSREIQETYTALKKQGKEQLKTIELVGKKYGDAASKVIEKSKGIITPEQLDAKLETVKGLSEKEKEDIYRNVMADLVEDLPKEEVERISKRSLKNLNKKQFDAVVYYKEKEIIEGQKIAEEAREFSLDILRGNKNEQEITDFALEKLGKLIENRKKTIETASGAAQAEAEISKSMVARRMNKLFEYMQKNAAKLDNRTIIDLIADAVTNPNAFDDFFNLAGNALKHGKIEQFFDRITFVRQNIMLASGITQLKDISSTLGFRMTQWADTATAAALKNIFVKPYRAIKKKFTKPDQISAKVRLGLAEVDDVELMEIWDNILGMGDFLQDVLKYRYRKMTNQLIAGEISPTARHINQIGASASKYNFKKNLQMDVIPHNDPFSNMINTVLNHSGIYVSEAKDDVMQAMFHSADIRTQIGSLARRALRNGEITEEQLDDFIKDYLMSSKSWSGSTKKTLFDFTNGLTKEARLNSIMQNAAESSGISTFRSPLTGAVKDLYDTLQRHAIFRVPLRIISPFQKTGMVIAIERGIKERGATALLNPSFWKTMKYGGREAQMAAARMLNGLAAETAVAWAMLNGKIIGPMPKNKGERELLQAAGAMEYSVRVGDKYYSITDVAGPYGPLFQGILSVVDGYIQLALAAEEDPENENKFQDAAINIAATLAEAPIMTTMFGGILENAERGDVIGVKNVIRSFASGPRIIGEVQSSISRLADWLEIDTDIGRQARYQKKPVSFLDRLASGWGGEGSYRYDIYGQEMKASYMSFATMMSSEAVNDPVTVEMIERKAFVSPPSNTMEYDSASIPLTDEEVKMWYQEMGDNNTYTKLYDFINTPQYKNLPDTKYDAKGNKQNNKTDSLKRKYNELKKEAAKKLIDKDAEIGLKYKAAKQQVPIINLNPYMEMIQ